MLRELPKKKGNTFTIIFGGTLTFEKFFLNNCFCLQIFKFIIFFLRQYFDIFLSPSVLDSLPPTSRTLLYFQNERSPPNTNVAGCYLSQAPACEIYESSFATPMRTSPRSPHSLINDCATESSSYTLFLMRAAHSRVFCGSSEWVLMTSVRLFFFFSMILWTSLGGDFYAKMSR